MAVDNKRTSIIGDIETFRRDHFWFDLAVLAGIGVPLAVFALIADTKAVFGDSLSDRTWHWIAFLIVLVLGMLLMLVAVLKITKEAALLPEDSSRHTTRDLGWTLALTLGLTVFLTCIGWLLYPDWQPRLAQSYSLDMGSRWSFVQRIAFQDEDSPVNHGWELFLDSAEQEGNPELAYVLDPYVGRALSITSRVTYGLEYAIPDFAGRHAQVLRISGKIEDGAALYVGVQLSDGKGQTMFCWLQLQPGNEEPRVVEAEKRCEWLISIQPSIEEGGGWQQFDIDLAEAVRRTEGSMGWSLQKVSTIRLRGNLSLHHLDLFEIVGE